MHPPQRLAADEPLQAFDPEGELAEGEGPLVAQAAAPQAGEVPLGGVVGAVDDPQVLSAPGTSRRAGQAPAYPGG